MYQLASPPQVCWIVGSSPGRVKPKTMKLVFVAYPLLNHAALRRKSKDWLARNRDNMSELGNMSICGLLSVSQHYENPTQRVGLVQSGPHHYLIEN